MLANKDKSVGRAWRDDTSGGAADILDEQLGDVGIPQDCATALKKLYDKTSEDPLKCPVPSFSCFEEALRCLKPAHRLELSSVCSSAVGYLESIAWSQSQEEALFAVLSQIEPSSMVDRLWARFEPSSKNSQAAMLDDILQRATLAEDEMGRNMARSYFQKLVASNVGKPEAADIVPALRRILTQLDGLNLEGFSERPFSYAVPNGGLAIGNRKYATDPLLSSLVSSLAWVFQLPNLAADTNVKHDVLRLTASLPSKIGQELYKWQIFHRYIAEQLFLPIAGAIAGGELVVGADTRAQLLGLWVPQKYALYPGESIPYPHSDTMQAAFLAVLSTVQIDEQAQILRPWRDDLMGSNEAWYEEWLDGFFGATNQRRLVARGSEPASRVGPTSTVARGLLSGSPVCPRIAAVPRLAERRATSHIYDFKKDAGDSLSFRALADEQVETAPTGPLIPTRTLEPPPFASASMPGVASTGPVDAALDPKSTLQKVSGEEIGLPQGSKTPTFGTATGVLLTPLFEGAGGQDKGAPDSARLTRAETGGAQVQKDYFVRPSASDMSRWLVTGQMGATPTAPATLLPQSPPVNPPVPSGPPFVCNYPPNTSPFSKPFGLQESFAGGTPEGLTKTPPETLISHYESVQATLKAGLESLGARPGANGGSTRVKRTAAELGVGEPSPVKRPKVADPVAAAEVGATEGVDANAEAREFEEVVPPAANVTETERNRVPAESGESGDRAEGEAVAAEPADSSAKVLSAEDAIPGSVSQSETEAENHRPRRRSFRQALFEEEHAVLNGLMRAAHDRGGPNRAPLPLPAVGQELRSRGLTVGGRFLRPSQVARQHPWFFDIHTKADPVGKEVPADVSLTQKGWEEAERMLQQEVAAKMTSAMVASPLVSSSRGGGVIVARPVVGSGGEGLEGSVAKEGPGGALDSFAEGLNDAHAVGERVSGEKANAPGLTEAKTATGVLARGKAEGRSEEEIWGKPKPKEPGTAPETREEIHDLAPETPASDLVPGGAVGQTGEECRDRVGSKETGIKHVGSADVAMSSPAAQATELSPSAAAAQPTPVRTAPRKTANQALLTAILQTRKKVPQTLPAAAEAVGAAVDRTERSAPFEKGLAGATGKVKVAGNGTGNGNGNENGYENGLGTEMSRGLTPTDASGRQKRSEADAIEREGAGLKMKRRADSEEDGPREPGEGVECPVKCQKRFEAGAKEKDSGGSESEGWQSVTAEFEENDEMPKVVTDAKPKGFEAASCDEPATTGAGRPTGSAGERPTEAPTGAVNLRQPRKEIESLERETEGGLARLQEPPLDRTSDEKAILAREAAENGGPKFGIDVTRTEGVILEKPLVEMLAGFGARPPAASPVRGDATGENTETAQPVSENRIACVPLAEPSATGAAPEERKRSAEPEERKSSAKAGSAAEVSERKRSTGEESAAAAKRTVDVEEPPRLSQNPAHIAGNEGVTGGYDFYAKLTPAVVTGGLSQGLSGASRPPSRQSFSAYPSPPPAKSETDDWVDGPSFEETRWMLLGGGAAITGPGKRAGNMFGAQHGGNAGRENGQPTLGIGSPGRNTPVKMVPPDYVGGGLQPVAGPADGSAAAPRPPSVNLSPRADVPAAGRGEARHSYTRRQPSLYRVPQERMRAVLSPSRAPVKLCAAHAQDPEGCTDRFCTYSHASKEERFCMQFFDEDEMGVGPGCRFGALRCFFGHGEASRAVYRAYRSTIDYV